LGAFLETLRNLGPLRLAVMGGVILGLVAFFIFIMARLATPPMALLYGDLDPTDTSQIVQQLDAANVPYELDGNGTQIKVPVDEVARLRMTMAGQGLPRGGSVGYEIFDESDNLGTTNFVQNVNLVRALEGELARTIRAIDTVQGARVHLVLPRRQLFSRERQEPSASIILKMRTSKRLSHEQVVAVQHLVAAAVPGLTPERISVVDDKGTLLARGFDDAADALSEDAEQKRIAYENRLARTIEQLLEKSVGFGNVRAEVRADMDFDRVTTKKEVYDPDGQVVRSSQLVEDNSSSKEGEQDLPVSVGNNLPDANSDTGAATSSNTSESRTEETTNYEISKKVVNTVREAGVVNRLSVAVLVDGTYGTDAQGNQVYKDRTPEEMDQFATLVRTAIGYDADRGDSVEVINMRFVDEVETDQKPLELLFGLTKNDLMRMAEILVLSIVAILVILLVVRPLISRAFEAMPAGAGAPAEPGLLTDSGRPALTAPGASLPSESAPPGEEEAFEELIDIDRVEGRVKASSVRKVGEIVDKHPEEAIAIIRTWMYQEG
jgi:flagellar M-ring protein FliF